MKCRELERAAFVLAGGQAPVGGFETVIERIAHQVHQRIADLLEHRLVEFGALAEQLEFDLLAELAREVVHDARKAVERKTDRQHANLHHAFLQLARIAGELRKTLPQPVQIFRVDAVGEAAQHRLGDEQFAHQVDDVVDFFGGHADGAGFTGRLLHRAPLAGLRCASAGAVLASADAAVIAGSGAAAGAAAGGAQVPIGRISSRQPESTQSNISSSLARGICPRQLRGSTRDSRIPGRAHRAAAAARHRRAR